LCFSFCVLAEGVAKSFIAAGKSNPEIAKAWYIALRTVRVHVHAILYKLGVRDRTQAVGVALQNRLISD
jgi:two-component system, NarL family, response regulator